MNVNDFKQMRDEIEDGLSELGLISIDSGKIPNIQWLQRRHQEYDKVYNVNVSPSFVTYDMYGAVTVRKRPNIITVEGVEPGEMSKVLISPVEFISNSIVPHIADRVIHGGTVYAIVTISRMALSYTGGVNQDDSIDDASLLYSVFLKEANFAAQSQEYRDKADPYFNEDASQPEAHANVSGANTSIFTDYPAEIIGTVVGPYEITPGFNDVIKVSIGTYQNTIVTISTGTTDVEYASATIMASYIQARIASVMGTSLLAAVARNGKVILQTVAAGTIASMELKNVSANPYVDFGWRMGVALGKNAIALAPSSDYVDGNPVL